MTTPPTPRFDAMLAHFQQHASSDGDRLLLELFTKHRQRIARHFEDCVPDGQAWMGWSPAICPRNEAHGPGFHKGFRQWDVTGNSADDMTIWKLLAGDSTCFWDAHAHSMADAQPEAAK